MTCRVAQIVYCRCPGARLLQVQMAFTEEELEDLGWGKEEIEARMHMELDRAIRGACPNCGSEMSLVWPEEKE